MRIMDKVVAFLAHEYVYPFYCIAVGVGVPLGALWIMRHFGVL